MTSENSSRAQQEGEEEPVSRFEELPFRSEKSSLYHHHLPLGLLQTDFSQVSSSLADQPHSSSLDSPAQSRRYMQAGLDISFAEYHRILSLKLDKKIAATTAAATVFEGAAAAPGLVEHHDDVPQL